VKYADTAQHQAVTAMAGRVRGSNARFMSRVAGCCGGTERHTDTCTEPAAGVVTPNARAVLCGEGGPLGSPDCQRPNGHAGDHQSSDSEMLSSWPATPTPWPASLCRYCSAPVSRSDQRCTGGSTSVYCLPNGWQGLTGWSRAVTVTPAPSVACGWAHQSDGRYYLCKLEDGHVGSHKDDDGHGLAAAWVQGAARSSGKEQSKTPTQCTTPSGRTDCHGFYQTYDAVTRKMRCDFCKEYMLPEGDDGPVTEPSGPPEP
jgi:hypothetical protein